ncbi:hypothetical protein H6G83_18505 [Anabaena azotica FACHB-119]|uniref:Uncharacterized protein n=2 Tax=Anabaena azotica TaxID=197653 RepID=A0ABR8D7A9_9NOST|nr:hypothetical protein [Anabaena azotica FACHB-119]
MWHIFILILLIFYLVIAYLLFKKWLFLFLQDEDMSSSQRSYSGVILLIATIFWPVVVPFAYLELLNFQLKYSQEIQLLKNQADNSNKHENYSVK